MLSIAVIEITLAVSPVVTLIPVMVSTVAVVIAVSSVIVLPETVNPVVLSFILIPVSRSASDENPAPPMVSFLTPTTGLDTVSVAVTL